MTAGISLIPWKKPALIERRCSQSLYLMTCRLFAFPRGLDGAIDFSAMAGNDRIQFLLDLAQDPRRIDTGEIAVDMLVDDFDEGEEFGQ